MKKLMLVLVGVFTFSIFAQDEASERARRRQYPGGKEEESLEVQAALPVPVRKVYRQTIEQRQLKQNKKRAPQNQTSESAESPDIEKE